MDNLKSLYEPAKRGDRTIYVKHGVWREADGKIAVTVGQGKKRKWYHTPGSYQYETYKALLIDAGRWPEGEAT